MSLPSFKIMTLTKDVNQYFTKEVKVANKHIKKCLLKIRIKETFHLLNKTLVFSLVLV